MKKKKLLQSGYLPLLSTIATSLLVYGVGSMPGVVSEATASSMEEIIVTSRKREESLQDVPFSVQALTGETLEKRGAINLEDLSANVAGFSVQNLGPGQSQIAIRGISAGQVVRDQPGVKEQVGVYLDESPISLSLFTPDLDFVDTNRIEVLRGPQGTLYGSGSIGGTVRYITNKAEIGSDAGFVQVGVSSITDGGTGGEVKVMKNIALSDKAAARFVAYNTEYGGFIDAIQPGGSVNEDVNDGNRTGFRLGFTFQPDDTLTIQPRIIYQDIDVNGFNRDDSYNILANPFTTTRTPVTIGNREQYTQFGEKFEDEFLSVDLTIEKDFGAMTFTSVTSYADREILVFRDATALTGSITAGSIGIAAAADLNSPLSDTTDVEMFTQELRLASNDNEKVNWIVGLFYSDIEREYGQSLIVQGADAFFGDTSGVFAQNNELFFSNIPYEFKQIAVFGEVDFQINDKTRLSVGGRYYDFDEDRILRFDGIFAAFTNEPGNTSSDGFSPRALLAYDLDDDTQINAQISHGFRLGGINDPLNIPLCDQTDLDTFGGNGNWDDEELTNYELGIKTSILNGNGTFNASVFYADIENLQATLTAGTCSSRVVFNVPDASATGVELEINANVTDALNISLTGSYVESEVDSDVRSGPETGSVILGGIRKGNRLPTVPELQFALAADYDFEFNSNWDANFSIVAQHVGSRFTQLADQEPGFGTFNVFTNVGSPTISQVSIVPELPSYEIVNTRLALTNDNTEWSFYIKNLFDEEAKLSLDTERGGAARNGFRVNQPRTIGVNFKYNFAE